MRHCLQVSLIHRVPTVFESWGWVEITCHSPGFERLSKMKISAEVFESLGKNAVIFKARNVCGNE